MASTSRDTGSDRPETHRRGGAGGEAAGDRLKRATSAVLGCVLLARGLRQRSLRGTATALVGGWLLFRALGTNTRIKRTLGSGTETESKTSDRTRSTDPPTVSRSIIVGRPADELFEMWRDPDQFSRIVGRFAEITSTDEDRLDWTLRGPGGRDVSWETQIGEEKPGEYLRWETPPDATIPSEGTVHFRPAPGDRGTEVTLSISFDPPGGTLGNAALKRLDVAPETLAGEALRRFKSLAESGEIPTLEKNPSARGRGDLL